MLSSHIPKNIRLHSCSAFFMERDGWLHKISALFLEFFNFHCTALQKGHHKRNKGLKSLISQICLTSWQNPYPQAESLHGAVEETSASRWHGEAIVLGRVTVRWPVPLQKDWSPWPMYPECIPALTGPTGLHSRCRHWKRCTGANLTVGEIYGPMIHSSSCLIVLWLKEVP